MTSYQNRALDNTDCIDERVKLMNDLRSHHFNFGGEEQDYGTQAKIAYKPHKKEDIAGEKFNFQMEDTLELGNKNANLLKASYYGKEMKPFPTEAYSKKMEMARDQTSDRKSNRSIGHFGSKWCSEAKKNFQEPE